MNTRGFPKYRIISTSQFIHVLQSGIQNNERFCFILGSGASVDSGIPMGGTLEKYWMDCLMGKSIDKDGSLPFDREEIIKLAHDLKNANPPKLEYNFDEIVAAWDKAESNNASTLPSKYYFDIYKVRFFPNHRNGYHYLETIMDKADPSIGYRILAQLLTDKKARNNLVITTNFDSLVEDSLFLYTREKPLVINHELLADYLGTPNIVRPIVAKVHRGLFFDPLNAPEDVNQLKGKWREVLKQVLSFYTPIVIGYGGGDHSLMDLLNDKDTKMPNGIYWCYMDAHGLPERNIQNLVENNNGCFVRTLGFDPFMFKIGDALYPQAIGVNDTANYLKKQSDIRADNYRNKVEEIQKQVQEFTTASDATSEYQETVKKFNQREDDARKSRESTNTLTVWDHLQQGIKHLNSQQFNDAISSFTRAIELKPDLSSTYINRGATYDSMGKYEDAIADYNKAIELNPEDYRAYVSRGATYDSMGKYEDAIADYNKAIELNPEDYLAYVSRGSTYDSMEKYEDAITDYNKAIELNPEDYRAYVNRGSTYDSMEKYEDAITDYNKVIELNPEDYLAYVSRGSTYDSMEKYEDAIANYNKAIELNPENCRAYVNRGVTYDSMGKYEDAIADYNKAIELNPEDYLAYVSRGITYDSMEKYEDAIADYNKAIELNPEDYLAYVSRGITYDSMEKYEDAIADYNKAIELNPEDYRAYVNRGSAYNSMEKYENAISDCNKVIQLAPTKYIGYNNRGVAYKAIGELDKAIIDFQIAIKIDETAPNAHRHLGDIYALQKKNNKSINEYGIAIRLNDKYREAYEGRARVYREIGKIKEAEQDEKMAKEL